MEIVSDLATTNVVEIVSDLTTSVVEIVSDLANNKCGGDCF